MSKLETNTIDTVSGTSTLQVGSTNTSTITLGVSGDTVNVPSGVTIANSGTATGFGGDNTPAFQAYMNGNQNIANTTWTKLEMDAEVFDTDSKYDVSNYRFTPTVAGKYWVWGKIRYDETADINNAQLGFYLNGSLISKTTQFQTIPTTSQLGITVTLDSDDYLEIWTYHDQGSASPVNGNSSYPEQDAGTWGAYKLLT